MASDPTRIVLPPELQPADGRFGAGRECLHGVDADLRRPRAEPTVGRLEFGGRTMRVGSLAMRRAYASTAVGPPAVTGSTAVVVVRVSAYHAGRCSFAQVVLTVPPTIPLSASRSRSASTM